MNSLPSWLDGTALDKVYAGNTLRTYLVVALVLTLGVLVSRAVGFALVRIVPRLTAKTTTTLDDRIVEKASRPLATLVVLLTLHVCLQILEMPDRTHDFLVQGLVIAAALTLAMLLLRIVDAVFDEWMAPWAARQTPAVHTPVVQVLRATTKLLVIAYVAMTVLQRAGFDVWSLLTGLGIGGLAVALAAQETLGNLLGSLQIMTDRPFAIGDWIEVEGSTGKVVSIGLRSTRLQNSAGSLSIIPNKKIAQATVLNHSHPRGLIRDFTLDLVYRTDAASLQRAVELLREILAAMADVAPDPTVQFASFGDSSLKIRCIYHVPDDSRAGEVRHAFNLAIRTRFEAEGLLFAFPTRTLLFDPPLAALVPPTAQPSPPSR